MGSGLTVSSPASQPESTLIPESATRVPFVRAILTASADGDVTVKSVTVERKGLAEDAAFDGVLLLDENGDQIGTTKTLSSDHKVILGESFVVKAGTSKTVTVAGQTDSDVDAQNGQVARLEIIGIDAGSSAVNGSFPIASNGMTMNSTLALGTVTMSIGSLDPGSANTKDVGTKGYYLASVRAAVGSAEDVTFESIRFNQAGSAAGGDLKNVKVVVDGVEYDAQLSADGKYYRANFPNGIKKAKGTNVDFSVKGDLVDGSDRTVDMNILRKSDIVAKGDVFGYYILAGGGSSGAASAGGFSSNNEPFFNAYAATINKGSLLVSSSNTVSSTNIPIDVSDTVIGGFMIEARGEPVQISAFRLEYKGSGTGTSTDITGVKIVNASGAIQTGPKDFAATVGNINFTDTWTVPVGENHYKILAKLDTTYVTNDTAQVLIDPDDNITAKGETTGLSITASPTSQVTSNSQTVKAAALAISVSPTPFGQNVVRGVNGYHFATYVFDAGSSGEDARVTSIQLQDTTSATTVGDEINSCVLYDGATQLNTGTDVKNPSDDTDTDNDMTFTLTNNLVIPKGTVKKIDLKCNISSSAAADSTHAWGTSAAAANVNSVGATTGQAITETITTSTGSTMSVKTAGSFTVVKDASAPSTALVTAGKTDVLMNVLKYDAKNEAIKIDDLTLTFSSSTASTSDFTKVTLWDGATKIGEAVWAGPTKQFATSTLTSSFIVPKDGSKLLTLKADLASISVTASSTAGRLLAIDYDGIGSSTGTGQSSGAKLGSGSSSNSDGASMQMLKSIPTLAKISVPSLTMSTGEMILYRFSVTAPSDGPIALYKFTFQVGSSSVSATTSAFKIFGYSDPSFTQNAYAINPLHLSNTLCIGNSPFDTANSNCASIAAAAGSATASSSEVVFFFGPSANLASTTEAIIVSAGTTRYFEMRGTVTNPGAGTGNSFSVKLLGDAARPVRRIGANSGAVNVLGSGLFGTGFGGGATGESNLATAAEVAIQGPNNDFVWSPMSTSTGLTGATSTPDWTNGFNVPGLPTTEMAAHTITQ